MLNKLESIYERQVKKHKEKVERYYTPECGPPISTNTVRYNHLFRYI